MDDEIDLEKVYLSDRKFWDERIADFDIFTKYGFPVQNRLDIARAMKPIAIAIRRKEAINNIINDK